MKRTFIRIGCFLLAALIGTLVIVGVDALCNALYEPPEWMDDYEPVHLFVDMPLLAVAIVVVIALILGALFFETFYGKKEKEKLAELAIYKNQALTLQGRHPMLKYFLKVKPVVHKNYKYNDPKLVYTGATVGGITTGGFHVQGGDYTEQISNSGRYELIFNKFLVPEKIILSEELTAEAKTDHHLRKLLKGNELALLYDVPDDPYWISVAMAAPSNNITVRHYAMQQAKLKKHLTKADCEYIKKWLCAEV